ncbi:MAG: chromosome segregation protein ScpA [Chloroflexi bacterium]|nr:chromosome segregation protein ScpA [Chloroflexota bacterium]MYD64867.1 chromosome segregation protein ScpA [Chloroflexota bacterium]
MNETTTSGDQPTEAASTEAPRAEDFALELPVFNGPLELLLHLIEREELDVTEVSLVAVTEQYLGHLERRDHIDLAAIAAFIAVGARLLLLKSRALLPRDEDDEAGDEDEDRDPEALLEALREYRRYRAAAEHLRDLEEEHRTAYRREVPPPEVPPGPGLDGVTTDMLFVLFREVLERLPEEDPEPELSRDPVRLADRLERMVTRLRGGRPVRFRDVIVGAPSRLVVIVDFLAVLELVRSGYVEARQPDLFGEIELVAVEGASPPSPARVAEELPGL